MSASTSSSFSASIPTWLTLSPATKPKDDTAKSTNKSQNKDRDKDNSASSSGLQTPPEDGLVLPAAELEARDAAAAAAARSSSVSEPAPGFKIVTVDHRFLSNKY